MCLPKSMIISVAEIVFAVGIGNEAGDEIFLGLNEEETLKLRDIGVEDGGLKSRKTIFGLRF